MPGSSIWTDDPRLQKDEPALIGGGSGGLDGHTAPQQAGPPLKIVAWDQAAAQLTAPYLIKGWLQPGEFSAVIGLPGCGKTFLTLDISAHLAAGLDWAGYRTKQTPVVYLAAEGGTAILDRVAALKKTGHFVGDVPLAIVPANLDFANGRRDADELVDAIKRAGDRFDQSVGVVVGDTISRLLGGGDENDSAVMGSLIRNIDYVRAKANCHFLGVHHSPKDGAGGRGGRGHSSLWGALDTEIDVSRHPTSKICTARVFKQRNGPEGAEVNFELDSVPLGADSDGEEVRSCVIRRLDHRHVAEFTKVKMSAPFTIALAALRQAVEKGGQPAPASKNIPVNARVVSIELWRKIAYAKAISDKGADAKRKAFKRAAQQLEACGIVGVGQSLVWLR